MNATLKSKSEVKYKKKREPGVKTILKETYTSEDKKIKRIKTKLPQIQMYGSVNEYLQHKMKLAENLAISMGRKKIVKLHKETENKKRKELYVKEKLVLDI